jgi:membrane protease YdiL (CAAX protease family)
MQRFRCEVHDFTVFAASVAPSPVSARAETEGPCHSPPMFGWGVAAYTLLALVACVISWFALDRLPFTHPEAWLGLTPGMAALYSLVLGGALGGAVVLASRASVGRFAWARRLHQEFRPFARQLSAGDIVILALLSSVAEELLFRGLLQPLIGLVPQALLFGIVHQTRGSSRWVWVLWAGTVGFGLGLVFQLTGSIWGATLAHAMVNGINLSYLKNYDPEPPATPLGGLLDRRPG